jgi:glycosyltransferase involved in cell wall biosynthesis
MLLRHPIGKGMLMRIAQIAPLDESVPPKLYGGTERIVSYLTEELVAQGHEVSLFASADSRTSARLIPCCERAYRLSNSVRDSLPRRLIMLRHVLGRADQFDVIHFHGDHLHLPYLRGIGCATVTTLHCRLDDPELALLYETFPEAPLVSISRAQRAQMPAASWAGTVYHGIPVNCWSAERLSDRGYLAFLGRICPEKRPDRAIEIAKRCKVPLKIAAKVDPSDQDYWNDLIRPMVERSALVEFVGEIDESRKGAFLGGASALLFPIDWPEPFGLVMIEAMANGTPTIAWRAGSVPEVIDDGLSGFLVSSMEGAVEAVRRLPSLPRAKIRAVFERRFTAARMTRDYIGIYQKLTKTPSGRLDDTVGHPREAYHEVSQVYGA